MTYALMEDPVTSTWRCAKEVWGTEIRSSFKEKKKKSRINICIPKFQVTEDEHLTWKILKHA